MTPKPTTKKPKAVDASSEQDMRVVSWNICCNRGATDDRLDGVVEAVRDKAPDILLLQEVFIGNDVPTRLAKRLHEIGLLYFHHGGATADMRYGNVIASRFAIAPVAPQTQQRPPWPHLIVCASVATPEVPTLVFSVHVPNGSKYKWKKIETFESLVAMIDPDARTIVGGDFNEPELLLPDGRVLSFVADEDGSTEGTWLGHPRARWQSAVDAILGSTSRLQHAWLSLNPGIAATTHINRGRPRFFDHLLVSHHFEVLDAGFEHDWRVEDGPSDHSGAWVRIPISTIDPLVRTG